MPAETYEGRPCKDGHTRRWRSNCHCTACAADEARPRVQRRREDSITYFTELLNNRRYKALRRWEARNGQVPDQD